MWFDELCSTLYYYLYLLHKISYDHSKMISTNKFVIIMQKMKNQECMSLRTKDKTMHISRK